MKQFLKQMVLWILTACAQARLARMRRYGTRLIGVTGSIGKTTCKEAIAHVLRGGDNNGRSATRILSSEKSYNTEFGLPLTILELKSEFSSVVGWAWNLILAVTRGVCGMGRGAVEYDFLILEMGVDKPGDMDLLLKVLGSTPPLRFGVITGVHPVHMADGQFADMDAIFHEKAKLVKGVKADGAVLLNYDDARCRKLALEMKKNVDGPKIVTYGGEGAELCVSEVKSGREGLEFLVEMATGTGAGTGTTPPEWGTGAAPPPSATELGTVKSRRFAALRVLGKQHVSSLLPAIGCGLFVGMDMSEIAQRMKSFQLPPGRLSAIEGINGSLIIDSSYNASPDAVRAAVDTLVEVGDEREKNMESGTESQKFCARKIFVFGNMNELGAGSEKEHREIVAYLRGKVDVLITVGDMAGLAASDDNVGGDVRADAANAMNVISFDDALSAAEYLKPDLKEGDIVLVKGSQNEVRLERLVKAIMKDPSQAKSLLARQDWADA